MEPAFKTVGEVKITNRLWISAETAAYDVAIKLIESGSHGLSVLNNQMKVVGKITEMDLLKALKANKI